MSVFAGVYTALAFVCVCTKDCDTSYPPSRHISGGATWFWLHRLAQIVAVGLTILGFTLIVVAEEDAGNKHFHFDHAKIGLTVMIMAVFQPVFAVIRPHAEPKTRWRRFWEMLHKFVGYSCSLLGFANIITGLKLEFMTSYLKEFGDKLEKAFYVEVALCSVLFVYFQAKSLFAPAEEDGEHEIMDRSDSRYREIVQVPHHHKQRDII
mmetsp:Transcript_45782/g.73638  ORF Transcript_45782/g.73638 Transcript_45782/m.73638 type:complete len:208 (+) Transcript_45782:343-966(+)